MIYEPTDIYNRRKWICFMKNLAMPSVDFMILVDYRLNTDGSSRAIIPIMKKLVTTSDSSSLIVACDMIQDYLSSTFGMAVTSQLYRFVTIAYYQECSNFMRRDVKRWWSDREVVLKLESMLRQKEGGEK